jgi:hypothetical protein
MKKKSSQSILPQIHAGLFHLLRCWDELNNAESILGFEISVDELSDLAAMIDQPDDAARVTEDQIEAWLNAFKHVAIF